MTERELPIIQKTYDLILWYIPHLNKMPRDHKFGLGDKIAESLYLILDRLIEARYRAEKISILREINITLERVRYQTRLMKDFQIFSVRRYEYASGLLIEVGGMLGNWIKQQEKKG
jgi:hypothetical protein